MSEEVKCIFWGTLFGLFLASLLNTLPFSDAEQYRRAIKECERTLPRDQHCRVIGVPGVQK
jgi:hypothetical protein